MLKKFCQLIARYFKAGRHGSPSEHGPSGTVDEGLTPVLPPPVADVHEMSEILLALQHASDHNSVVLLHGNAGSGKTTIAAEFAHWYRRTSVNGSVIFADYERRPFLPRLLDQIRQEPVLLILDNIEPSRETEWEELVRFLSAAHDTKARVLLTSRHPRFLESIQGVSAPVSMPRWEHLRHYLQSRFPKLYAQVLEPTLADLREEHSAALAEGRPLKAWRVLLRGCGALTAAAVCQFGYSLLRGIAALWRNRGPK